MEYKIKISQIEVDRVMYVAFPNFPFIFGAWNRGHFTL